MPEQTNLFKKSVYYAQMACFCDTEQAKRMVQKAKKLRDKAESLKKTCAKK